MKKIALISLLLAQLAFSYTNINNSELEQLISDDALLVDVRLEDEWIDTGIINGSKTFTYFDKDSRPLLKEFTASINKIAGKEKSRPIVLICRTGVRSVYASEALDKAGYKQVYNLKYGIMGWLTERKKVVKYQK